MRFGYRRLTAMLLREGMPANHKRVYRLYREEGLAMRIRQRRRIRWNGAVTSPAATKRLWHRSNRARDARSRGHRGMPRQGIRYERSEVCWPELQADDATGVIQGLTVMRYLRWFQ